MTQYYTGTGDKGDTGLFGGSRVSKASTRMDAIGNVDELQALLGLCRAAVSDSKANSLLHSIQGDLFSLNAGLANPDGKGIGEDATPNLEKSIYELSKEIPPLQRFIFPSGSRGVSLLHLARTVCRRAERSVVALEDTDENTKVYLNRLSSLLFVLARYANTKEGGTEEEWVSK